MFAAQAQTTPSDSDWSGTWVGTYSFPASCGVTNTGNVSLTFTVSGGSVSGSGLEDSLACFDSYCNVISYGNSSGSLYGTTSGTTITLSGSWTDSCNNRNYETDFKGFLTNGLIVCTNNNITLQKLSIPNSCLVDWNTVYQRIDGFGASSAFSTGYTTAQADMFFSTNVGIGLSLLRTRIAPDGTTSESNIMQLAQARGAKVWSAPWSPPAAFKDSGSVNGGNFISTYYQAYANQLADYVLNMKNQLQINIYAVSVQNEPNYTTTRYESCAWGSQQYHDFVPYLSQALSNNGVGSTKIMIPEEAGWDLTYASVAMNDPAVSNQVNILGGHGYFNTAAQIYDWNTTLWETEASSFDAYDGSMNNGIYWGEQIHEFLTLASVNAFHFWELIAQAQDNEALTDTSGNPAKRMYVLGQYSRFVRPGFYRIGAFNNAGTSVTAYKDPVSANFAIVAINPNSTSLTQVFTLANFTAGQVTPWVTSSDVSLSNQPPVFVTNATFSYVLPGQSVVTFVGETNNVTISTQPQSRTVAAGDTAVFSIVVSGAPPLSFFWQQNGVFIPGATNSTYILTNVPAVDNGSQFSCVVSNSFGAVSSLTVGLTVANPLYAFRGSDGSNPYAAMMQAADGNFYGTTSQAGTNGFGTVFRLGTNGGLTTLVSFNNTNGATPMAGLFQTRDGNFYGTTEAGGAYGLGTVFRMTTNGQLTTLVTFNNTNGATPLSGLVQATDGNLYGTTEFGGSNNIGTVFKMTTNSILNSLFSFNSASAGAYPATGLIQASDGNFYGTTSAGGSNNYGAVFQMSSNGVLSVLASFNNSNGATPMAGLFQANDGNFYGTTKSGGSNNFGTVFRITTNGALTTLLSFNNTNGATPLAALIQGNDGKFYGTTSAGGQSGFGTIFGMDTNGLAATLLSFGGAGGASPEAALVQGSDRGFYGTTALGGIGWNGAPASGNGTVFRLPFPSLPVIFAQPANQLMGLSNTAIFTINANSTSPLNYSWLRNGAVIAGATNSTLTLTNALTQTLGNYEVIIANTFGSVTSTVANVVITNAVCSEPSASISAWWPGANNSAMDIIGGHNGTLVNGVGFTNAFVGTGFSFNGGAGYVALPVNLFPVPNAGAFSLELWFETTTGGVILEQQNGAPFGYPNGWLPMFYVGLDGNLYIQLLWNGYFDQITSISPVNDGGFHHLAVTYDGNNEVVYLDGTQIGAKLVSYSSYSSGFACQLGTGYTQGWPQGNGGWYTFNGLIDEPTLYTNALTAAQVRSIYNAGTAGKCTDELSPIITSQPASGSVLAGSSASFTVTAACLLPLSYQWFQGTNALATGTNATLSFARASAVNAGSYVVVASDFYSSVTSAVVTLNVTNKPCVEQPPGIFAWYPGQNSAVDIAGGQNGTLLNGASLATGFVGNGFSFNGAGYVQLPANLYPPANGGPFSLELWFETTTGGVILGHQNGQNGWLPEMYVGTDGNLYTQLFWNGAFNQIITGTPVNDGSFHHVAATYDGANEVVYLDGAQIGSKSMPYSTYTSNFVCELGSGYTAYWPMGVNGTYPFNGVIDEVTLYSNALTSAQVQYVYNAGSGGKCTDEFSPAVNTLAIPHVTVLPNHNIQMTITGLVNMEFRVLASTNLKTWQTIATLTNLTGSVQFTDSTATNFPARYYQLVTP